MLKRRELRKFYKNHVEPEDKCLFSYTYKFLVERIETCTFNRKELSRKERELLLELGFIVEDCNIFIPPEKIWVLENQKLLNI